MNLIGQGIVLMVAGMGIVYAFLYIMIIQLFYSIASIYYTDGFGSPTWGVSAAGCAVWQNE